MQRVEIPELLDTDAGSPREVADSLADLRWFNRFLGGRRTTALLLRRIATRLAVTELSFLDVAAASADNALYARERLAKDGVLLSVTVMDRAITHLARSANGIPAVVADALRLPFASQAFDVVGSSLFMHHLQPGEAVSLMRESSRVARHAVIINDLRRHPVHWLAAYVGAPLYRSRITRHDAPASVRRAYTAAEIAGLAKDAGASRIDIANHYFFRMGVILWR